MTETKNNQATTSDWIEATKDLEIAAYPKYQGDETEKFTKESFEHALRKVARPKKDR